MSDRPPDPVRGGLLSVLGLSENGDQAAAATEELRQIQAGFRALVNSLPLSLLIKDLDGRRVLVNQAYLDLHQKSLPEVLGKTDFDLFPEEIARKLIEDDQQVLRTGEVLHGIEEHRTRDGRWRWIERIKGPVRDADGQIVGVQVLFWDVTDRKDADEALERERYLLHSLLDNIPDAIYFKDRMSRFLRISRSMANKFGMDPEEAIGKTDADIFTEEHASKARADELKVMRSGAPIVAEVEKETWPDRADTWCSTTKMPLRDRSGNIVGTFGISRDVTELKHIQDSLREARDAADMANRAKSDFLANMSHEIRTPMNAIIGMTELLLETQLTPTQREYLIMVQESGNSLLNLLNDILDFSKIEAGKLELDPIPFEIREALGDTMRSLALRAHAKGLELAFAIHSDVPFVLKGDIHRLRQILVNLVGNAIKFTHHGEVVLEVHPVSLSPGEAVLQFEVRDTGIGIPADKLDTIFEEFQQADTSTTRTYGGTGLGLAISTRLVEAMQGRIWAESTPGSGSIFRFTVRLETADESLLPRNRSRIELTDLPVLIVDDNATNRRILLDMLSNWGLRPVLAVDARTAFETLREARRQGQPFRLLVSDVNMPGVDGFELAAWIREDLDLADLPIIMLTSSGRPGDVGRRSQLRINANMLKPAKQSELFDAIVTVLGMKSNQEAAVEEPAPADLPRGASLHVLLAEDNKVNQTLAVGVLSQLGHEVTIAENGQRAIDLWEQGSFDVILMDVQMPVMDGLEAVRIIRERERGRGTHIPVIAMTAHAMKGDRERCLEAGMDEYLSKPVRKHELAGVLTSISGSPRTQTSASAAMLENSPIDWKDALDVTGGDRDLLCEVIAAFLDEAGSLMQRIREKLQAGDADGLRRHAHSLKGGLMGVGAREAADLVYELECLGQSGDTVQAGPIYERLEQQMAVLIPALQQGPP